MNERIILDFEHSWVIYITQVNLPWFPITDLFVVFPINFLAYQNVMGCIGADLTFDLCDETLT